MMAHSCWIEIVNIVRDAELIRAVYADDMFVNMKFSRETVDFVPNMKAFYTSEFEHCGLRVGGENLFSRLIDLGRGEVER